MSCAKLTFKDIVEPHWRRIIQKASGEFGISISSNSGEESKSGFTIKWGYDVATQILEIQCLDKPFVPCALVNSRIEKLVNECRPPAVVSSR